MKHFVDLTGKHFDRIDFGEAKIIDIFFSHDMPSSLEFTVWGAVILMDKIWNHSNDFLPDYISKKDQYVSGIGTIRVDGLKGGNIKIFPYDMNKDSLGKTTCAKNRDGTDLLFMREWKTVENSNVYVWECVITYPYGFCCLKLYCDKNVSFEFDDKNLIPLDEYLKHPSQYSFNI